MHFETLGAIALSNFADPNEAGWHTSLNTVSIQNGTKSKCPHQITSGDPNEHILSENECKISIRPTNF